MAERNELEKVYDPKAVEPGVRALWKQSGAFRSKPDGSPPERTFTIVIPPPNVTGALHLGHALNNTLQDILIRYHRMRGFNTLWQPGTDHAGIATQAVVEKRIREQEGKTRHELGRDELVKRIWQWKDDYEKRIISQLELMGCSCDWDRIRFTLDEGLSKAVRQMFFRLFKDGLIFRGKRLVNWDTQLQTAVSDDEVYYETVKGHFYHFKYPVIDPKPGEPEHVIIATTRPETMLGDTAVAVHPDPEGFFAHKKKELEESLERLAGRSSKEAVEVESKLKALAARRESALENLVRLRDMANDGRMLLLPLVERKIPLVCDDWAKPELGSGCVKITPAHDPNDYEVGIRKELPMINVLTADGKIAPIIEPDESAAPTKPGSSENANSDRYAGLTFSGECRAKVVADLEERGLLHEIEDHDTEIGHSDRSKLPIEPYLSDQWFIKTNDVSDPQAETGGAGGIELGDGTKAPGLAQAAMDAVEDGRIHVFPSRYAKSYLDWLSEKRDWCISRQLWWGHRMPVWSERRIAEQFSGGGTASPVGLLESWGIQFAVPPTVYAPGLNTETPRRHSDEERIDYFCIRDELSESQREALCNDARVHQEDDVLDTWFSSALWPFSTLGWPDETEHLKQFYPGSVLITSRDIITNWVARMVMFGLYAIGKIPFDHVYIHPKILDGRGETMSKSKGNGVDPVDTIDTHGADALRYAMADMTTETQDIRMPVEYVCPHCGKLTHQEQALKVEEQSRKSRGEKIVQKLQPVDCKRVKCANGDCGLEFATQWAPTALKEELGLGRETSDKFDIGRNFCNKLWNAARFAFLNLEGAPLDRLDITTLPPEDRWILARLSQTIRRYHECLASYQFSASIRELREFFWDCLCDWYIELTKPRISSEPQAPIESGFRPEGSTSAGADSRTDTDPAKQVLAFCLDQILRLLHPTVPFITERLWQQLNHIAPARGLPGVATAPTDVPLVLAEFPPVGGYPALEDDAILATFAGLQDATRGVRELRAASGISPKEKLTVTVVAPELHADSFRSHSHIVRHMANIGELRVVSQAKRPRNAASAAVGNLRIYVHDISDDDAERDRTTKALDQIEKQIAGKRKKLDNERFVAGAPADVVEAEKTRLAQLTDQQKALLGHLAELKA